MEEAGPPQPQFDGKRALRSFLITVTDRCTRGWHLAHQLGFIPQTSLSDKLPFYAEAVAQPEVAARLSYKQERFVRLQAACAISPPDTSRIRQRPKRARDAFGPGMVLVVNTVLVWLLFSIDVRNAMLR